MSPTYLVFLLMASIVGGWIGWTYGTHNLYRRRGAKYATDSIEPSRINRHLLARRKRQRRNIAVMCALIAPILLITIFGAVSIVIESLQKLR